LAAAATYLGRPARRATRRELINGQPRSPDASWDKPLPRVSHHVRELYRLGALELTHTEPRRGALAHFYRAKWRVRIEVELID